jgi:hypothetical protein
MDTFKVDQSPMFQWYQLISEARKVGLIELEEDAESYLVFLLMRFMNNPEIARSILSTEYLEGLSSHLQLRQTLLQNVGDKCLVMAGLFPARARKKRVKISYFVRLGQSAYTVVSQISPKKGTSVLYNTLSHEFVPMMDVLQTTRELDEKKFSQLNPLEAYDLWSDTHSAHALKILEQYANTPLITHLNTKRVH